MRSHSVSTEGLTSQNVCLPRLYTPLCNVEGRCQEMEAADQLTMAVVSMTAVALCVVGCLKLPESRATYVMVWSRAGSPTTSTSVSTCPKHSALRCGNNDVDARMFERSKARLTQGFTLFHVAIPSSHLTLSTPFAADSDCLPGRAGHVGSPGHARL